MENISERYFEEGFAWESEEMPEKDIGVRVRVYFGEIFGKYSEDILEKYLEKRSYK